MYLLFLSLIRVLFIPEPKTAEGELLAHVYKGFSVPRSYSDCRWTYAIVSVKLNSRHIISGYDVLATNSDSLKKRFSFLEGRRLLLLSGNTPQEMIFSVSIENRSSSGCDDGMHYISPNELLEQLIVQREQFGKRRNARVVHEPAAFFLEGTRN